MKISPEKFKSFKQNGSFSIPGKWRVGQVVNVWADNCGSRKAKLLQHVNGY